MSIDNKTLFIRGEKISLRPVDLDDVEGDYLRWVNDSSVTQYMGTLCFPTTKTALRQYIEKQIGDRDVVFFAVVENENGKHIGNAKLGPIDWINRRTSFGRMVGDRSYWGKGYGTEITKLLLEYAFLVLNLNKVTGAVSVENEGSIRSNLKAGFSVEGRLKEYIYNDGCYKDALFVGITRKEYMNIHHKSKQYDR